MFEYLSAAAAIACSLLIAANVQLFDHRLMVEDALPAAVDRVKFERRLRILNRLFWLSILGFLALPAGAFDLAVRQGGWFQRALLTVIGVAAVGIVFCLIALRRKQWSGWEDKKLRLAHSIRDRNSRTWAEVDLQRELATAPVAWDQQKLH